MIRIKGKRTEYNVEVEIDQRDLLNEVSRQLHKKMNLEYGCYLGWEGDAFFVYHEDGPHRYSHRIRELTPEESEIWRSYLNIRDFLL